MKKDVWLSITSTQQFEGCDVDKVDLVTTATLYPRRGKYYIVYEESELTGMEGSRTTVKLSGHEASVVRTGSCPSELLFAENERHVGLYHTPFGAMTISTHTSRLCSTVGMNGGRLVIDYTLEVDQSLVGENHLEMIVAELPGDNGQD